MARIIYDRTAGFAARAVFEGTRRHATHYGRTTDSCPVFRTVELLRRRGPWDLADVRQRLAPDFSCGHFGSVCPTETSFSARRGLPPLCAGCIVPGRPIRVIVRNRCA